MVPHLRMAAMNFRFRDGNVSLAANCRTFLIDLDWSDDTGSLRTGGKFRGYWPTWM
jgi:hypothetical protein